MLHLSRFEDTNFKQNCTSGAKRLYTDAWLTFGVSASSNRNKSLIKDVSILVPCNSVSLETLYCNPAKTVLGQWPNTG